MKKVAVVILNYRLKDDVIKCVLSVKKSSYKNIEIIVIDNNSGDNLEEEIGKIKSVSFVQSGGNLGYAGGNNLGIKKALNEGADFIFVLNPDTIINEDTIKFLVEGAEKYQAAIVSPKIYFWNSKVIWYVGGIFDCLNVLGSHRGVNQKDVGQFDQDLETDFATGAALMVRKEIFDSVGFFDERYFLYYEESDLCYRIKQAGLKIMYIHKAKVYHQNAKSTGLGTPLQDYFITRNRMLFASKFLSLRTRFALFREAIKNIGNPIRRLAFFDFLIGNFGKGSFLK